MPEKGSLTERPGAEIFRGMIDARQGGVLRVASGKQVKVVVFEEGLPVYAISNVPEDQLEVLLVRQRKITPEQAHKVKATITKEQELPAALIAAGLLDADGVAMARIDQVGRIIQSVMRWSAGEYLLDLSARAPHDVTIEAPVHQWLLDTARSVAPDIALKQLGGLDMRYVASSVPDIELAPLDGFLMSRIREAMSVDELQSQSGLPADECIPVLYALYASGMIVRDSADGGKQGRGAASAPAVKEQSIDEIRRELDRVLNTFRDAELYEVLDIPRRADPGEIKAAYYLLAKQYHPDRYHHASDPEIRSKLEAIFNQISRAYDTLKDSRLRGDYDRRLGASSAAPVKPIVQQPPPPPPPVQPRPRPAEPVRSEPARRVSAPLPPPASSARSSSPPVAQPERPAPQSPAASQADEPAVGVMTNTGSFVAPEVAAENNYREGQRRFEQKDILGAIHLFREAIRICPDRGAYHLALGTALSTNARWYKEAERHLLEASRSEPMNVQIFLRLGQIYREGGLTKRAEAQYRAALGIDPGNRLAARALAELGLDVPGGKGGSAGGGLLGKLFKKK